MNGAKENQDEQTQAAWVCVAAYSSVDRARRDFKILRRIQHEAEEDAVFDVALVHKDEDGEVHTRKRERGTFRGAAQGVGIGAVLGVLIPFAVIPVTVTINVAKGGAMAYYKHGMSRDQIAQLGGRLASGEAALIVLSKDDISAMTEVALRGADSQIQERLAAATQELSAALAG